MPKILHIEDEDYFREDLSFMLKDAGFDVIGAKNGADALDIIKKECPDIVICDIKMPDVSGYDILKKIKGMGRRYSRIPFIFLSAANDKKEILKGIELFPDDYLIKPISMDILTAKIRSILVRSMEYKRDNGYYNDIKSLSVKNHINKNISSIIKLSNSIKNENSNNKAISSFANQILTLCIDISASIFECSFTSNHTNQNIKPEITENIYLNKLLETITFSIKREVNNIKKPIFIDIEEYPPVIKMNQKDFVEILEYIMFAIVDKTKTSDKIIIKLKKYKKGGYKLLFFVENLSDSKAKKICGDNNINNILSCNNIKIGYQSNKYGAHIYLNIPKGKMKAGYLV